MKVTPVKPYNQSFKAHFYNVVPKAQNLYIKTDNNPYLGDKPVLIYKRNDNETFVKKTMKKITVFMRRT